MLRSIADAEGSFVFSGASFIQRTAGVSVQQSRLPAGIQWPHVVRSAYYCSSALAIGPCAELGCGLQSGVTAERWVEVDEIYLIVKTSLSFSIAVYQLVIRSVDSLHQERFQADLSSFCGLC